MLLNVLLLNVFNTCLYAPTKRVQHYDVIGRGSCGSNISKISCHSSVIIRKSRTGSSASVTCADLWCVVVLLVVVCMTVPYSSVFQ